MGEIPAARNMPCREGGNFAKRSRYGWEMYSGKHTKIPK